MTTMDHAGFTRAAERHRHELRVHCYRMLGSFEEAEDLTQETLLRAWRARSTYAARASFRAWLYKIATNACLDHLDKAKRQLQAVEIMGPEGPSGEGAAEVPWLQPYPDELLDAVASEDAGPDAAVVAKETVELAFLVAVQHLPPRQRAALILRDVLEWSAKETAAALELSVPAANSALQRARATMQAQLPERRAAWATDDPSAEERALVERFIALHEACDVDGFASLITDGIRVTMPPHPWHYEGIEAMRPLWASAFGPERPGDWRLVPVRANRMPAAATYLRAKGDTVWRGLKIDVLRVADGRIAEITTFGSELFPRFGLPLER